MERAIGKDIEKLRRKLAMSQTEFGKLFKATPMTISRWERGENSPDAYHLIRLGILAHKHAVNGWPFLELAGITKADLQAAMTPHARSAAAAR